MTPLLDLELLRTLVVASDVGGLMRAAPQLGRTRSAVSLQMRRLEAHVGAQLLRKQGRRMVLTPEGEVLLGYARRLLQLHDEALAAVGARPVGGSVRLGAPQDLAERLLPMALGRFARAMPEVAIEARVGSNASLLEALDAARLDLAVVFGDAGPARGARLAELPMRWLAAPMLALPTRGAPLPLVLLDEPCVFRRAATAALDAAGLAWRVTFSSPSLPALWAAAKAGLGLTVRTPLDVPRGLRVRGRQARLPPLPLVGLWLCGHELSSPAAALGKILRQVLLPELGALAKRRLTS